MADITMPQLGETVTEGTITKWFKKVGDKIDEDENLYEVSTDKVDSEVPSPVSGYVSEILVEEGETVDVGVKVAVISDAPPAAGDGAAPEPKAAEPEVEAEAEEEEEEEEEEEPEAEDEPAEEPAEDEPAEEPAEEAGKAEAPSAPAAAASPTADGDSKVLSPVVRRLIAEHDLNPADIKGSGAGGRITRADVLALIDAGATAPAAEPPDAAETPPAAEAPVTAAAVPAPAPAAETPAPAAKPAAPAAPATAGLHDERVPFSNIRKRTAEHMVRSQATSAHTLVVIEVDYAAVDAVRTQEKETFKQEEGFSLTYLPFVSRAVVDALHEFPHLNASVGDNELIVHKSVNLGIAVDLNFEGLLVPVIKDADTKRLRAIAREVSELAAKARGKKLTADDISAGTFTITNPGPHGTLITGPIINQPQVAILSTDGVKKRPVVVTLPDGTDAITIHPVGNLAIAFDHRANDGAYASAFLAKVKEILESRDWSQEL